MSHLALQRVIVRMLYDSRYAAAVAADPQKTLRGEDVSATEASWLAGTDPRAFGADSLRRLRTLHGLVEEYPAAGALAVRLHRSADPLIEFFSSPVFHDCVRRGAPLAVAFGDWLLAMAPETRPGRRLSAVAAIERGVALLRRREAATPPPGHIALSSRALVVDGTSGAVEVYRAVLDRLGAEPLTRALDPAVRLGPLPALTGRPVRLLLERGPDGVGIEVLNDALGGLLDAAREGLSEEALVARAIALGADPAEAPEIIAGLLDDGLLSRRGPAS